MIRRISSFALLSLLLFAAQAFGQGTTGSITGVVADSSGAVLPNATVRLTNESTGVNLTTTAAGDGVYNFTLLKPGTYKVTVTAEGFADNTRVVEVQVGRTTTADISLGVGDVAAEVTVSAESVQTTESKSDAVLSETAISNLPINGRRFQDFVTLTPTAQVDPQRGQISLAGQRGINSNINVDGVDYNQPFFGGIRGGERANLAFTIPQESIREFNVVSGGYSPEFGRSTGGVVNAVTKSGTNDVRGSAFYLWRPEELSRQNEFVDEIERVRNVDAIAAPTQHQFGGSIGGPIVTDRLFYFGALEFQRFEAPREVLYSNLRNVTRSATTEEAYAIYTGNQTSFTQTNDAWAALGRVDWQANSNNLLTVRFNYSKNNAENANATGETTLDPTTNRALSTNGTEKNRNRILVAQLISNFTPNILNDFRFQLAREDRPRFANAIAPNVSLGGVGEFGTRTFLPTTQYDERLQFADSLTILAGNHTLKLGGEFSDIYASQLFGFNQTGAYFIGGAAQAAFEAASLTAGSTTDRRFDNTSANYRQQIGNLLADYTVRELAFFAQDNWRITPRFQIDFGIRAEQQYNPDPQLGNDALISLLQNANFPLRGGGLDPTSIPDSGWQFGPRVGFAWDLSGNGKSVLRGFGGLFYARTPLLLLAAPVNNFRDPAGDLSVQIPFSSSALSAGTAAGATAYNAFLTANPGYVAALSATGLSCPQVVNPSDTRSCVPNSVYRQFLLAGVNLNSFGLDSLPQLSRSDIDTIAAALGQGLPGLAPIGIEEDFKNPRSIQLGLAYEREVADGLIVGVDFLNVNTSRLERNRELNLPVSVNLTQYAQSAPGLTQAQRDQLIALDTGRPIIGVTRPTNFPTFFPVRARPVTSLGSVQIRESSARSLYTSLTFRARLSRSWGILNAYYTVSRSLSDDDNERSAGGQDAVDTYNLIPEYGPSRLDRRHQFVANPVFFLPFGFEVSSAIRIRSGLPVDAIANADLNGDTLFNDRPVYPNGEVFTRNMFRNRSVTDIDARIQKGFGFGENRRVVLSAEFFNVFNLMNLQYSGSTVTAYCSPVAIDCGVNTATNPNFLQLRDSSGNLLLNNNPGSQVFQMQLGARFQF
ncbi:MAG: TonB-dependent receptor [Acidobacteriota bacterium]|nr:MAG: TonB-dependent receptor [Acidobacteriota bacterium]